MCSLVIGAVVFDQLTPRIARLIADRWEYLIDNRNRRGPRYNYHTYPNYWDFLAREKRFTAYVLKKYNMYASTIWFNVQDGRI